MAARINIAIDGPASSGKGTVARLVAASLGYAYIDTGAMYRTVALVATERGVALSDAERLAEVAESLDFRFHWDGDQLRLVVQGRDVTELIRAEAVGRGASDVAVHPAVRAALLGRQRALASEGGVVMDGRDIGTVVLPDADLKVFLDASPEERARRRALDLIQRNAPADYETILREIRARDLQDSSRAAAPLCASPDARIVDSTHHSAREVADEVEAMAREILDDSGRVR